MELQLKHFMVASLSLALTWGSTVSAAPNEALSKAKPLQVVGEWKIFKSDETNYNSCTARHNSNPGVTLSEQKLVIGLQETKDLKSYQISINNQSVVPVSRANMVDTSCNCVRVRNISRLNIDDAVLHIQGQDSKDKPVDVSLTLKNIPAVLQALKAPACAR